MATEYTEIADPRPGHYYVTIFKDSRVCFAAGPYSHHHDAIERVEEVKRIANNHDPFACFYAYGTARIDLVMNNLPLGKLNRYLTMPPS